jgi:hypothetical protein
MTKIHILLIISLISGLFATVSAQNTRFKGNYPLATPAENIIELKAEYEHTLKAIAGGLRMIDKPNTPSKKDDKEAFTKQDFKSQVETMHTYAVELATKLAAIQKDPWTTKLSNLKTQLGKHIKGGKNQAALDWLTSNEVTNNDESEEIFLIWHDYLLDKQLNAPWLNPQNIEVNRMYRLLVEYVAKNFDRPYGLQAEQGAISADAAQALSNCLEFPAQLGWAGEDKITLKKDDELRHLTGNIVFYEWRLYTPINGQRAAAIDRNQVRNVKKALYETVFAMHHNKREWHKDKAHAANILQLYKDALDNGWAVDGLRAIRRGSDKTYSDFYQAHTGRSIF